MKEKNLDKKLNILVVCQYYTPEPFLINEIAPRLVQRGHQVTVLTGLPNYPEGIVPDEYRNGKLRDEMIEGVHVIRCEEVGRAGGKLNLLRNYFSYQQSATKKAKHLSGEFDLVLCYQLSPITMLAPAVAYKKKYNKPILTYCLDIWPESAQAHVPAKAVFKPIYQLVKAYSRKLYGECDRIVVTSEPFISYLHDVDGVSLEKMAYVPQHANGEMLDMDLSAEENGIADFMFAGNLGKGQKIETIAVLTAMQFLPGITKVFCMDDIIFYALWFLLGVVCAKYGLCNAKEKNSGNEVIDRTKINYNIMLPSVIIFGGYIMNRILGINSTLSVVLYELLVLSLMITGAGMVQKHLASFSARFGKFTYPIYIMSLPIQNMIGLIAVKIGWGTEVTYWILFVAGIVILYVVSELILLVGRQPKLRWIQYVVGL